MVTIHSPGEAFAGKGEEVGDRRRTQRGGHRGIAGHRADTRGTQSRYKGDTEVDTDRGVRHRGRHTERHPETHL